MKSIVLFRLWLLDGQYVGIDPGGQASTAQPEISPAGIHWDKPQLASVGLPVHRPMNSFHVGNSLTGNASRFATFLRTAGGEDKFPAYLIGGSLRRERGALSRGVSRG